MEKSEQGFIKVPIDVNTNKNEWFVRVANGLGLDVHISRGNYIVEFDDPIDIYTLGCRMVEFAREDFITDKPGCRLDNPYYRKYPEAPAKKRKKPKDGPEIF